MKTSNIKYQKSKISGEARSRFARQIKNQIFLIFNVWILLLASPLYVFAHETEVVHEEPVPTISPVFLIGIVVVLAIGGFIIWKFVLRNPKPLSSSPAQPVPNPQSQEKTVSQSGESEVSSQDK